MNTGKKMIVILQLLSFFIITYWFGWNRTISTCKLSSTPNKTYELIVIQRPYTLSSMTSPLLHSQSNGDFCQKNLSHNGILVPKLFWLTVRKNSSSDRKKPFEIRGWRPRVFKTFEITRTIYSNSERSEQFLVTECFFNLFLEVSQI